MKVDLDELTLEHKFSNHLKMTETLMDYLNQNQNLKKSDVLDYDQINEQIAKKIETHYASVYTIPVIISIRYCHGYYLRFQLLKSKMLKDKLSLTYEFLTKED
jgi:hypothetical protein